MSDHWAVGRIHAAFWFTFGFLACFLSPAESKAENWNQWHLGPVGVMGEVAKGTNTFTILEVSRNTPGSRARLHPGDVITAVNGRKFETTTFLPKDGGKGPLEALGWAIDKVEGTEVFFS